MKTTFICLLAACAGEQAAHNPRLVNGVRISRDFDDSELTRVSVTKSVATACGIYGAETYFELDSAQITRDRDLDRVADCLAKGPLKSKQVAIVGHTDARGDDTYNKRLGRTRADQVAAYLQKRGVASSRMTKRSAGEEEAIARTAAGAAYERRVDIDITP